MVLAGLFALGSTGTVDAADDAKRPLSCSLKLRYLERDERLQFLPFGFSSLHSHPANIDRYVSMLASRGSRGEAEEEFLQIVKTEPAEYQSKRPFRGVITLGSRQFAFVFDSKMDNPLDYRRLYFDRNSNGDLTDDDVIEATQYRQHYPTGRWQRACSFPRVDVTVDVDGTELDFAFFVAASSRGPLPETVESIDSVLAGFSTAVCREGELVLDGEPRRVVLLDYNSNGRFDDAFCPRVVEFYGTVHSTACDRLLIETKPSGAESKRGFELEERYVSKLVEVDGRYFCPKVSSTGDTLTLAPVLVPMGSVSNPNDEFSAMVHGDGRILKIRGGKSEPIPLPEGDWSLLSYGIKKVSDDQRDEKPPWLRGQATTDCKPVSVRQGQTVAFPFGPPLRPVAKVTHMTGENEAGVTLFIVGSAGEVCRPVMSHGRWMDEPKLTITTPEGRVIVEDEFGYSCNMFFHYQWTLPFDLAHDYHAHVRMKADPLEVDDTGRSVIRGADLRERIANEQ